MQARNHTQCELNIENRTEMLAHLNCGFTKSETVELLQIVTNTQYHTLPSVSIPKTHILCRFPHNFIWEGDDTMPRTKFDKPKRDALMELILGRKAALKMSEEEMASKSGICRSTLRVRLNGSSDKLTVGDLKAFSKALDIPIEEIRQAIKM